MKKLKTNCIGIDQGDAYIFSDFEDGGEMWTGEGDRERRHTVRFSQTYRSPPAVTCGVSLWDLDHSTNVRSDVTAENIGRSQFDIVFRTWGDSRIARVRVNWMAIGELTDDDHWDVE